MKPKCKCKCFWCELCENHSQQHGEVPLHAGTSTLSDKFHFGDEMIDSGDRYYSEEDVKEFIKRLKEEMKMPEDEEYVVGGKLLTAMQNVLIDKLAGDKLT